MPSLSNVLQFLPSESKLPYLLAATVISIPLVVKYLSRSKPIKKKEEKDTIVLHGFPKRPDSPSASVFCQKVEVFLRATSTPYQLSSTFPNSSPKGKLPYITIGDTAVPDSHFILMHLVDTKKSANLNAKLTRTQLADSRAWQAYFEELVYFCMVWERWCEDANFKVFAKTTFARVPWFIRSFVEWDVRRKVRNELYYEGVGRHSREEIHGIMKRALDDLESKIDSRTLTFHGTEEITEIDVIIYSFMVNALGTEGFPVFSGLILERPKIVAFTKRITQNLFPEYKQVLQKLESGASMT